MELVHSDAALEESGSQMFFVRQLLRRDTVTMPERGPLFLAGNARRIADLNPSVNVLSEPQKVASFLKRNTAYFHCFRL